MNTFHWIREWAPSATAWNTVYEAWGDPGDGWIAQTQQGSLVIDDMLDDTPGATWRRETLQSWGYGAVRQGKQDRFGPGYYGSTKPVDAPAPIGAPPLPVLKWTALSSGSDVTIRKNYFYDVTVRVKATGDLKSQLVTHGGFQIYTYEESPPSGGYRTIHVVALATKDGDFPVVGKSLPWSAPWYSPVDWTFVSAKTAPADSKMPAKPQEEEAGFPIVPVLVVTALAGGAGWYFRDRLKAAWQAVHKSRRLSA